MLGFIRADNAALVSCLGDPQRTVAAYRELLRRGPGAAEAIRSGLKHDRPAVREGCCRLLDHLVDTDSMGQLIAMSDDPDARVRTSMFHALACWSAGNRKGQPVLAVDPNVLADRNAVEVG